MKTAETNVNWNAIAKSIDAMKNFTTILKMEFVPVFFRIIKITQIKTKQNKLSVYDQL